ncbi:MAG: hypothetical protein ACRCZF_00045 [Gemmataceae bacterium]
MVESFRTLAAVIAAHPNQTIDGRTRLQKTVCLLQRLGMPTDYSFGIHFYGPYSEDLHAEMGLLKHLEMVEEVEQPLEGDKVHYKIVAKTNGADPKLVIDFQSQINVMAQSSSVVLELAATYDFFRSQYSIHETALERLRHKKGSKCKDGNEAKALKLLTQLGLPSTV